MLGPVRKLRHDLALRLLRDGYLALDEERRERDGADAYVTRLLGHRTVVVRGEEGVRLFYDEDVVARTAAVPPPLAWLLFGRGAVHGLDGDEHRRRKRMFLDVLARERTDPLVAAVRARLEERVPRWADGAAVFDELVEVYGGAVLGWAGVRVDDTEARTLSHRMAEMVDGFGFAGMAYVRGWRARIRMDRWAKHLVRGVRDGSLVVQRDRPLAMIAADDELDDRTAGVELLNVLRPTVAVAWPATMAIAHLLGHPDRHAIATEELLRPYVHECRRLQPFAPALTGLVKRPVSHDGVALRRGDRIVLDIVGTHTDPRHWAQQQGDRTEARDFDPHRFAAGDPSPYTFVPQGGGDPAAGHRCPGEPLTVRLLETTLREVARHDLRPLSGGPLDLARIPTLPDPPLHVAGSSPDAARTAGYRTGGKRSTPD